jgi:hypothetical protein
VSILDVEPPDVHNPPPKGRGAKPFCSGFCGCLPYFAARSSMVATLRSARHLLSVTKAELN